MEGKWVMEALLHYLKDLGDNFLVKFIFSYFTSITFMILGDFPDAYRVLVALLLLDLVTGLMKAIKNKNISTKKASYGIVKIFLYTVTISVGIMIDRGLFGHPVNFGFTYLINSYLLINTAISVIKNLQCLGVPIPKKILCLLEMKLKDLDKVPKEQAPKI